MYACQISGEHRHDRPPEQGCQEEGHKGQVQAGAVAAREAQEDRGRRKQPILNSHAFFKKNTV